MLWSTTTQIIETVVTTHWNPNRKDKFFVAKIVTFAITRNVLKMHQHTNSDKLLSLFPRYSFRRFSLRGTQHLLEVGGLSRIWRVLTDHAQPKNCCSVCFRRRCWTAVPSTAQIESPPQKFIQIYKNLFCCNFLQPLPPRRRSAALSFASTSSNSSRRSVLSWAGGCHVIGSSVRIFTAHTFHSLILLHARLPAAATY